MARTEESSTSNSPEAPKSELTPARTVKRCSRCGKILPVERFAKRKASKDGLQPWCRACVATKKRRVRQELKLAKELSRRSTMGKGLDYYRERRDELAGRVLSLRLSGLKVNEIAEGLELSEESIYDYIARGKQLTWDAETREGLRLRLLAEHQDHIDMAIAAGELTEARLARREIAQLFGLVSTGGNTLNIGNITTGDTDSAVKEWIEEQRAKEEADTIDGEVVDDRALPAPQTGEVSSPTRHQEDEPIERSTPQAS